MALSRYIARRLVITVATLALISVLIFLVVEVLPGDVARLRVGQFATAESIEHARRELGLDRSLPARYGDWMRRFATGDWGDSWRLQIPIRPLVLERLANSAILAGLALAVIVPVSFLGGIVAAMKRNKLADRVLTIGGMFGIAVPEFVSSMFLILAFSLWLPVFPSSSLVPEGAPFVDHVKAFVLPVTALTLVLFGYISRMVRASMIEELLSSYTRTAVLKGLSRRQVVFKHVLRNALLPSITVVANQVSWLVGGLVVVENVFNYPGIGQLLLRSGLSQDVPLLEVTVLITAAILMLSNLVADLLYGVANPRVRVQGPGA
jgi:peptide/nickel transport system permease protein